MFHYVRRIRSSVCIYFGLVGQQCKLNFKYSRRILNEIWFKIKFSTVAEDSQKLFQNKAEDVSFLLVYRLMGVGALIRALGWTAHHIPRYYPGTTVGTVRLSTTNGYERLNCTTHVHMLFVYIANCFFWEIEVGDQNKPKNPIWIICCQFWSWSRVYAQSLLVIHPPYTFGSTIAVTYLYHYRKLLAARSIKWCG